MSEDVEKTEISEENTQDYEKVDDEVEKLKEEYEELPPIKPVKRQCRNCDFVGPKLNMKHFSGERTCRYNPPTIGQDEYKENIRLWPPVNKNDWCGKYSPRTNPVDVEEE